MNTRRPTKSKMTPINRVLLLASIWAGLPLLSGFITDLFVARSTNQMLFLFYLLFSWSIALLIFVLETVRQRLLQTEAKGKCAVRLAALAMLAILPALVLSPLHNEMDMVTVIYLFIAGGAYGLLMGGAYFLFAGKPE